MARAVTFSETQTQKYRIEECSMRDDSEILDNYRNYLEKGDPQLVQAKSQFLIIELLLDIRKLLKPQHKYYAPAMEEE